jgi:excisionase family DNA binding protein
MNAMIDTVTTDSNAPIADEVLRPDGTAKYLRVSLPTVMDLIHSGDLKAARVGRQWRIRQQWIFEYLDRAANA